MVMLDADRLASTVAPASAAYVLGGIGVHRSSQISTSSTNAGRSRQANTRSGVNGHGGPEQRQLVADEIARGAELALLVVLVVLGQVALGHGAEDPPAVDDDARR